MGRPKVITQEVILLDNMDKLNAKPSGGIQLQAKQKLKSYYGNMNENSLEMYIEKQL